nr:MAG: hypothetical protein [uncultured archaeon]
MLKINVKEIIDNAMKRKPKTFIDLQVDLTFEYNMIFKSKSRDKSKDVINSHISNFWEIVNQIQRGENHV